MHGYLILAMLHILQKSDSKTFRVRYETTCLYPKAPDARSTPRTGPIDSGSKSTRTGTHLRAPSAFRLKDVLDRQDPLTPHSERINIYGSGPVLDKLIDAATGACSAIGTNLTHHSSPDEKPADA